MRLPVAGVIQDRVQDDGGRGQRATRAYVPRGKAERQLTRIYERLGPRRLLKLVLLGAPLFGLLSITVSMLIGGRFLGLSSEDSISLVLIWAPIGLLLCVAGFHPVREQIRTALRWPTERRSPEMVEETWLALIRWRRAAIWPWTLGALAIPPFAVYVVAHYHRPWYLAITILVMSAIAAGGGAILLLSLVELLLRPLLRDVAGHLPPDFEPRTHGTRLRTKALAPLPIVTFFAAVTVGAYANVSANSSIRATVATAIICLTVAAASPIFLIVNRSVLDPIDELIDATHRVGSGDLITPVGVVTDDELGTLAHSFNTMLADLRRQANDLVASRERIVAAGDAERRRVERDLHDGAQQQLVLLSLKLAMAERQIDADPAAAKALHGELRADLQQALAELRDLAHGIYPAVLENEGVPAALREATQRSAIPVTIKTDSATRYRPELEAAVYFCCLEALQNAAKHAGDGATATVELIDTAGALSFAIHDTGSGFDPADNHASAGLQNMKDRIGALGGELRIDSAPGAGTKVSGTIRTAS